MFFVIWTFNKFTIRRSWFTWQSLRFAFGRCL